jgi:HSP20 family protein
MYYKQQNPFATFDQLSQKMANISNRLANGLEYGVTLEKQGSFNPRIDIVEFNDRYNIIIELAGVEKDNFTLLVNDDNTITLKGNKLKPEVDKSITLHRNERMFGEFERQIILPEVANTSDIKAKFELGILNVTVPKKEPQKPKEILIDIN